MNHFTLTPEESSKVALGLKLLAVRQQRLGFGDPATTVALMQRFRADVELNQPPDVADDPPRWVCMTCRWASATAHWDHARAQETHDDDSKQCPGYVVPGIPKNREAPPQKEDG